MRSLATVLTTLLLNCPQPQTNPAEPKALSDGVLRELARAEQQYCEDQFGDRYRKGCDKKFASNLKWLEVVVTPAGQPAILVENQNLGFCGTAGCSLYLFVQKADTSYVQILGRQGDVGTLKRFAVLKEITKDHYDVQVTWSDGKGHSIYRWNGTRYATSGE